MGVNEIIRGDAIRAYESGIPLQDALESVDSKDKEAYSRYYEEAVLGSRSLPSEHGSVPSADADGTSIQSGANIPAHETINRYRFPLPVVLFFAGLLLLSGYSVVLSKDYFDASYKFKLAERALHARHFPEAYEHGRQAMQLVPAAKAPRIVVAVAAFSSRDSELWEGGMEALGGVSLNKQEWERVSTVMPEEFKKYFHETSR